MSCFFSYHDITLRLLKPHIPTKGHLQFTKKFRFIKFYSGMKIFSHFLFFLPNTSLHMFCFSQQTRIFLINKKAFSRWKTFDYWKLLIFFFLFLCHLSPICVEKTAQQSSFEHLKKKWMRRRRKKMFGSFIYSFIRFCLRIFREMYPRLGRPWALQAALPTLQIHFQRFHS